MRATGLITLLAQLALASPGHTTLAARPSPPNLPLIPEPLEYTFGTGDSPICLSPDFQIQLPAESDENGDLATAVQRTRKTLLGETHQYLSIGRGREFWMDHDSDGTARGLKDVRDRTRWLTELHLYLDDSANEANVADEERNTITGGATAEVELRPSLERYKMTVPTEGPATITSGTALGLFRGLTTFEQLFYHLENDDGWDSLEFGSAVNKVQIAPAPALVNNLRQLIDGSEWESLIARNAEGDDEGSSAPKGRVYAPFAPYHITDGPKFGWRGLMLDTSRNFYPIPAIEKTLDTMAMAKMNVFHWHITDSETWPLDLAAYPEIARASAYSAKARYSEAQVQGIMHYAGERGIDVLIEVDMPGHTASLAYSHPEHIACFGKYWDDYAGKPPAGQLRFANAQTESFMKGYVSELVKIIQGRYISTGGDELSQRCMDDDGPTQEALKRRDITLDEALNSFVEAVHEPVRKANKTPVVWQESVLDHGAMPSLRNFSQGGGVPLVHVWQGPTDARKVLDKGFKAIHNTGENFYLDCGQGGWLQTNNGTNSWCDPYKTWQRILSFDPYQNITKEQQESGGIVGGQVNLWAEQSDEQNLENTVWPRAAALGELFWGGDRGKGYPRDARPSMAGMHDLRYRMVERGVRANALQPHWCAIRPGECAYKEDK